MLFAPALAPSRAPAASRGDRVAIQNLLDARSEAIINGDRELFLATVAPDSGPFLARQKALFDQMTRLPLESYRLVSKWHRFGDLVRPSDRAGYPDADDVTIPVTEERYRIRGYDKDEAVEDLFLTFVKRDERWFVAGDSDLDDLTLYSGRKLWDFGPVTQQKRGRLLQLSHAGSTPGHDYLGLAQIALRRVDRFWSAPWDRDMILLIPRDEAELRRLLQATFDLDDFVAFAYSTVDLSKGIEFTGHRIVVNPEAFVGRSQETVVTILAHEMLHVASRYVSGPFVPIFVDEGIADFVGTAADPGALAFFESEVAVGRFDGRLPDDFEFTVGSGTDIYRSYQESHSAVRYFVDRWGLKAFIRFYRRLGARKVVPGTADFNVSRALEQAIGLDLDEFEQQWADSIES